MRQEAPCKVAVVVEEGGGGWGSSKECKKMKRDE